MALGAIIGVAAVAGGSLWYLQERGYYHEVGMEQIEELRLTSILTGAEEPIMADNVQQIAGPDNPIRFRACFDSTLSLAMLTDTYQTYDDAEPLIAPAWFECFDAKSLGADLQSGEAIAFLGVKNITYGVDRVVAVNSAGQGFAWHQLNACGDAAFRGDPVPQGCPPAPEKDK